MSYSVIFQYAGQLTMLGWLLLAIVPYWRYTRPIVQYGIVSILLSLLYAYLMFLDPGGGDFELWKS